MANNLAIAAHTRSGDAILAHRDAHIVRSESGGPAVLARVMITAVDGPDGHFSPESVSSLAAAGTLNTLAF